MVDTSLSAMRIHRLPEELAPPMPGSGVDSATGYVSGVRMPSAAGHRRLSLRSGGAAAPTVAGIDMAVDRTCTLLVCFHDAAATAASNSGNVGSGGDPAVAVAPIAEVLPSWATELGLTKTGMKVISRGI